MGIFLVCKNVYRSHMEEDVTMWMEHCCEKVVYIEMLCFWGLTCLHVTVDGCYSSGLGLDMPACHCEWIPWSLGVRKPPPWNSLNVP